MLKQLLKNDLASSIFTHPPPLPKINSFCLSYIGRNKYYSKFLISYNRLKQKLPLVKAFHTNFKSKGTDVFLTPSVIADIVLDLRGIAVGGIKAAGV